MKLEHHTTNNYWVSTATGIFRVLWRPALIGVTYALFQVIGGLAVRGFGLDLPVIANQINPTQALMNSVLSGVLLTLVMAPVARRLAVPLWDRIAVLFISIVMLNRCLSLTEAYFFTTYFSRGLPSTLVISAVMALGLAAMLAVLFPPQKIETSLVSALRHWRDARSGRAWIWRIGLAGVLYLPTYFFFGQLVYPFVQSFYEDPSLGFGLRVPGAEIILPLEVVRGLIFILTVLPLIALLRGTRWAIGLWLGVIIAALGGWEPLLLQSMWPPIMRLAHGLEITADSLIQGLTIAWLVGYRQGRRPIRSEPIVESPATTKKRILAR